MKLLILAYLSIVASGTNVDFEAFKIKFDKTYDNAFEEQIRYEIFIENLKKVEKHNVLYHEGKVSFDMAINQFADMTHQEYAGKLKELWQPTIRNYIKELVTNTTVIPDSIDWRDTGCVSPVSDQGQCGNPWAICATAATESQTCIANGNLVELSVQELVDCSWQYGNEGCNGGFVSASAGYEIIMDMGGIDTEAFYPNTGLPGPCRYDPAYKGATVYSYVDIRSGDENALKKAVGETGPVSTCIDASHASFQLYNSGIYYEPECFKNILDHCVTIVGYGSEDDEDYWIVKNSWGKSWGEQGYIQMARNRNNNCGIATSASYPIVTE